MAPVRAVLAAVLWAGVAACGRIGFDEPGTSGGANEGCGLRDLAVGGQSSCAIDAKGGLWCWGAFGGTLPAQIAMPGPARKIAVGHNHACVLLESGKLRCFGQGDRGQLGDGTGMSSDIPVAPVGDKTYVDVATQSSATCAVTASGTVECWGDERAGLDDSGTTLAPVPVAIAGVSGFRTVFSTQKSMCADTSSRRFCWGRITLARGIETTVPTEVDYTGTVGLGRTTACMLQGGSLSCIGDGYRGDGSTGSLYDNPVTILSDVFAVAGGTRVHCAVGIQGELWCWGQNRSGEIGTGDLTFELSPVRVDVPPVARVALGYSHACAETVDGVYCWGGDDHGQLGRGDTGVVRDGVLIAGLPPSIAEVKVISRVAGGCARTTAGDVWCWGQGGNGLTGIPALTSSGTATKINLPFAAMSLGIGEGFACASSAFEVACWGSNAYGGVGMSPQGGVYSTPVLVAGLPAGMTLTSLTNGTHGLCVIAAGTPYCWGSQSGGGGATTALPVPGVPPAFAITSRSYEINKEHQCILDQTGIPWCWGSNDYGELGRGVIGVTDQAPMPITGGRAYSAIATSPGYRARTCGIPTGGAAEVDCWGYYDETNSTTPTTYVLSAVPIALVATGAILCAVFGDGTRDCVGDGYNGQLGDGTGGQPRTFEHVAVPATALALSGNNACFVEADRVRCVGEHRHGALGGTPPSATPMRVALTCK